MGPQRKMCSIYGKERIKWHADVLKREMRDFRGDYVIKFDKYLKIRRKVWLRLLRCSFLQVKSAREAFLVEWEKQARAAALSPDTSLRKRRDVSPLMIPAPHLGGIPYTYSTVYGSPLSNGGYDYLPVSPHVNTRVFWTAMPALDHNSNNDVPTHLL